MKQNPFRYPASWSVASGNNYLRRAVNAWIQPLKRSAIYTNAYDHWILGLGAATTEKRWSIVSNVLGWAD